MGIKTGAGGKGSAMRPSNVSKAQFEKNFENIFGKGKKAEPVKTEEKKPDNVLFRLTGLEQKLHFELTSLLSYFKLASHTPELRGESMEWNLTVLNDIENKTIHNFFKELFEARMQAMAMSCDDALQLLKEITNKSGITDINIYRVVQKYGFASALKEYTAQ